MKTIIRFVKKATLEEFYQTRAGERKYDKNPSAGGSSGLARKVSLYVILYGNDVEGDPIVSIRCPINPLPVRGKFTACSVSGLIHWLGDHGWQRTDCVSE